MSHYKVSFSPGAENLCWNKAADLIKDTSSVLDVGCSTGDFGRALSIYKKCVVDGVEPDSGDSKLAQKVLHQVFNGTVEEAFSGKLKEIKYDHIVFLDVIEHLVDPVSVLSGLKPHLAPGGSIIFSIPNMAHLSTRLMLLDGTFDYGNTGLLDKTHLHFYTQQEVQRVFSEAGYEVEVWDYTEATYPKELITKELARYGLTANKKALAMFQDKNASIFQFVGRAVIKKPKSAIERVEYSPDPQGQISRHYEGILREAKNEIDKSQQEIDYCNNVIRELQGQLKSTEYLASRVPLRSYMKYYVKRKLKP